MERDGECIRSISVAIANNNHNKELQFYYNRDRAIIESYPGRIPLEEWLKQGNYVKLPKRSNLPLLKGFICYYATVIRQNKECSIEEYEAYLRLHFKTGESPYDIDITDPDFQENALILIDRYDESRTESNRYANIAALAHTMWWCDENHIPYIMDNPWTLYDPVEGF